MNEVIRADEGDAGVLGHVIADAFFDLPPSHLADPDPDPDARREIFPGYFQLVVERALATARCRLTDAGTGHQPIVPPSS